MKLVRTLCAGLLTLSLALFPLPTAFASTGSTDSTEKDIAASALTSTTENTESSTSRENSSPQTADQSTAYSSGASTNLNESVTDNATRVKSNDIISFLYREYEMISVGEEENIVVGFLDESKKIVSAKILITNEANHSKREICSSESVQGASLFTVSFQDESDIAQYTIEALVFQYSDSDDQFVVDFSADEQEMKSQGLAIDSELRQFEVVTSQTKDLYEQDTSSDGAVSAYAIDDNGNFEKADSVSEAIEIADKDRSEKGVASSLSDTQGTDAVEQSPEIVEPEDAYAEPSAAESSNINGDSNEETFDEPPAANDSSNTQTESSNAFMAFAQPIIDWFNGLLNRDKADAAVSPSRENYLIVAINAGHGGYDPGATGNGLQEKDLTLSIAKSMYNELLTYSGVTPYLVRSDDTNHDNDTGSTSMQWRVDRAIAMGADVYVSIHINSGGGKGAEVWVPNSSSYNYSTHEVGEALGNQILSKLSQLGLRNRGIKTRDSENGTTYPDGSTADYLGDIRCSRNAGIPGIIVEHAFIDNSADASLLESKQQEMGAADATGVAQQYNLLKDSAAQANSLVQVKAHSSNIGWESSVYDQKVAGTTGKSFGLEAVQIRLQNNAATSGGIRYRAYVNGAWQDWTSDGGTAGTTGQNTPLQALQIELTGSATNKYDVYYRVHSSNVGWLGWASNGAVAGTVNFDSYSAEAVEVAIVDKGSSAPGDTSRASMTNLRTGVAYNAHVQDIGWQDYVSDGATAGTTGRNLQAEAVHLQVTDPQYSGSISYRAHVQDIGWQDWVSDGAMAGTQGRALSLEAVQIKLEGDLAQHYDVYYRAHVQNIGWMGWAKNGEQAGTQGYAYHLEALQVILVEKGGAAPGSTSDAFRAKNNTVADEGNIMGASRTDATQMARFYKKSVGSSAFPSSVYSSKGAPTIDYFCQIVSEEAAAEGVRAEVVFAQAMHETGWLQFGGSVSAEQCNFAGLGATDGSASGATFQNVREGVRAQVQHLKAYASTDSLNNACVDPRFNLVARGSATSVTDLNGKWAVPGDGYGESLLELMKECLAA